MIQGVHKELYRDKEVSFVDVNNSTTSTLGNGGVFTGSWTQVLEFSQLTVMINTDQASATNGLQLQFSHDGITLDRQKQISVPSSGTAHTLVIISKYFRLVYTNGTTPNR